MHLVALLLNSVDAQQSMGPQVLGKLPKLCSVIELQVKNQAVPAFEHARRAGFKKSGDFPRGFF
jgi:hypothetical protein